MDSEKRDKTLNVVSYIAFESVQARWERANKRLIIIIGILIGLLFASNLAWLCFMYGLDFESYDLETSENSIAAYIGNDMKGDITNGGESESEEADPKDGSEGQGNEKARQSG